MRIPALDRGHDKAEARCLRFMGDEDAPDVVRMLVYRSRFFGMPYSAVLHRIMREKSFWTRGERELFAAYTSRLNQCVF